jgi:hypothetical protein
MEKTLEKDLLYYDRCKMMPRHYNGSPIEHFLFKNVRTGEYVTLGACFYNEQVSNILGGHYYGKITAATEDFDILWKLSENGISVIAETFEETQAEYQRMVQEGVTPKEINSAMMALYQAKARTK